MHGTACNVPGVDIDWMSACGMLTFVLPSRGTKASTPLLQVTPWWCSPVCMSLRTRLCSMWTRSLSELPKAISTGFWIRPDALIPSQPREQRCCGRPTPHCELSIQFLRVQRLVLIIAAQMPAAPFQCNVPTHTQTGHSMVWTRWSCLAFLWTGVFQDVHLCSHQLARP